MLIYVAGAIDRASVSDYGFNELQTALLMAHARRQDIDEAMQLFIPARGWVVNGVNTVENARTLVGLNMDIVKQADIMVVRYDRGIETWGTPMEIQLAYHNYNTPIYVWSRIENAEGEHPEYIEARHLLPTYLLPYAQGERVWCDLDFMTSEIMKEYANRPTGIELEGIYPGKIMDILRAAMEGEA